MVSNDDVLWHRRCVGVLFVTLRDGEMRFRGRPLKGEVVKSYD
jgi:hypothetical protein